MALTTSEVARIKYEVGANVLTVGAEPYISFVSIFDQVIAPYTQSGASTTSITPIVAEDSATVVGLALASATGFTAGARMIVDVDDAQESATIRSVSGNVVYAYLSRAHSGTYPVTVEGGESIIREILGQLRQFTERTGLIQQTAATAGIKKADEVEFFGDRKSTTRSAEMQKLQAYWRNELCSALNLPNMRAGRSGGSGIAVY